MNKEVSAADVSKTDLPILKALYAIAVKAKQESFGFRGIDLDTQYCKYLIEYFEGGEK